jgi:hypothetical protein
MGGTENLRNYITQLDDDTPIKEALDFNLTQDPIIRDIVKNELTKSERHVLSHTFAPFVRDKNLHTIGELRARTHFLDKRGIGEKRNELIKDFFPRPETKK